MYAPHLWCIRTDNIQHNIIKLYLQAYYPVCYPPQFHYPVHMFLFQYDSYTILFVSTSIVPHFISFTYASCFLPPPFQRVFCTHNMFTLLRSIRSDTSFFLPVMVPTFNVAALSLIFLAFSLSSFLSFLLLHCFPPLLCIQVACPPVALGAQSLVTVVVFPGPGNGRCFPVTGNGRCKIRLKNDNHFQLVSKFLFSSEI